MRVAVERPRRGEELAGGVLRVEPGLDGVAPLVHVLLGEAKGLALRDVELETDQVESGDLLGDRVLDLQPGVHLQEEELPRAVVEQELHGAGAEIAELPDERHRRRPMRSRSSASTAGDGASSMTFWCRRCTEHSRSPRWTALPWVSPNTWISTWRATREVALAGTPWCRRTTTPPRDGRPRSPRPGRPASSTTAHALAAAARRRLDEQGVADLSPASRHEVSVVALDDGVGQHRDAGLAGDLLGPVLVPHLAYRVGGGPDEDEAGVGARLGEVGVLRQEAVPRVDRVGPGRRAASSTFSMSR